MWFPSAVPVVNTTSGSAASAGYAGFGEGLTATAGRGDAEASVVAPRAAAPIETKRVAPSAARTADRAALPGRNRGLLNCSLRHLPPDNTPPQSGAISAPTSRGPWIIPDPGRPQVASGRLVPGRPPLRASSGDQDRKGPAHGHFGRSTPSTGCLTADRSRNSLRPLLRRAGCIVP